MNSVLLEAKRTQAIEHLVDHNGLITFCKSNKHLKDFLTMVKINVLPIVLSKQQLIVQQLSNMPS